jgi:arylsulfatase A-like enzyme
MRESMQGDGPRLSFGGLEAALRHCWTRVRGVPAKLPALCVLLLAVLGCGGPEPAPAPNIVLIVVDTLRADHLGSYGHTRPTSPAIDAFTADAIRFERAYASAPWTKPSLASLLTGLHPPTHTVLHLERSLPPTARTLGERLREAGYATGAVISHHVIGSEYGFDQGFTHFLEDEAQGHMHVSTPRVTEQATQLLDVLRNEAAPFFLLVHYFDPHFLYLRHPEYGFAGERPERIRWKAGISGLRRLDPPANEEEIAYLKAAYDEEIRFTDAGIGRLLDALRERGHFDDSVIVLTADHGEEFYEHGWIGHTIAITEELVRVPLVARLPGSEGRGRVVTDPVSLVALPATLLELAGVSVAPDELQESSLLPLLTNQPDAVAPPVFVQVEFERNLEPLLEHFSPNHQLAVLSGPHKLVLDLDTGETALYDVVRDPTEDRDVADEHPEVVARLRPLLDRQRERSARAPLSPEEHSLSVEQEEMLRGLGYLEE